MRILTKRLALLLLLAAGSCSLGAPVDDDDIPRPPNPPPAPPALQETLVAVSGRTSSLTVNAPGASEVANSVAGTKDANNSTYDGLSLAGDEVGVADASLLVKYTVTTAAFAGTIDFLKVIPTAAIAAGQCTGTLIPLHDNAAVGSTGLTTTFTAYSFTSTTDELATAWTLAKINGRKWGYNLQGTNNTPSSNDDVKCSELKIEVWGH